MDQLVRRNFLKLGVAGVSGLAVTKAMSQTIQPSRSDLDQRPSPELTSLEPPPGDSTASLEYDLLVEPGSFTRVDLDSPEVITSFPWAVAPQSAHLIPQMLKVVNPTPDELNHLITDGEWERNEVGEMIGVEGDNLSLLRAGKDFEIVGGPDVSDLMASMLPLIAANSPFDLDLSIRYPEDLGSRRYTYLSSTDGLPVLGSFIQQEANISTAKPTIGSSLNSDLNLWNGYYLNIHGPEFGSFYQCDNRRIRHFNVALRQRVNNWRGYSSKINFHLGSYRTGTKVCIILWESARFHWCWRACAPTLKTLKDWIYNVLVSFNASYNVKAPTWALSAMAAAVATIMLIPLLAV